MESALVKGGPTQVNVDEARPVETICPLVVLIGDSDFKGCRWPRSETETGDP